MIGTAIGQMAVAVRFTTTTMFTCLIRRSHQHAATATILQDLRPQTVRGESAGPVESAGLVESAGPEESVGPVESAGPVVLVNRGELAGQAASGVQGELAGVLDQTLSAERILRTGWQDHLLAHTIPPKPGRTREPIPT
jgi:hypothetical protein